LRIILAFPAPATVTLPSGPRAEILVREVTRNDVLVNRPVEHSLGCDEIANEGGAPPELAIGANVWGLGTVEVQIWVSDSMAIGVRAMQGVSDLEVEHPIVIDLEEDAEPRPARLV
jgi:hypothetical protein